MFLEDQLGPSCSLDWILDFLLIDCHQSRYPYNKLPSIIEIVLGTGWEITHRMVQVSIHYKVAHTARLPLGLAPTALFPPP